MSRLFVVRHGAYERLGMSRRDEHLTELGVAQATRAAEILLSHEVSGDWQLLSSSAPRAAQSAEIIGGLISATPILSETVWRAGDAPHTVRDNLFDFAGDAIRAEGPEYDFGRPLAIITHLPFMAAVAGDPEADIENGAVLEYDANVWRTVDF